MSETPVCAVATKRTNTDNKRVFLKCTGYEAKPNQTSATLIHTHIASLQQHVIYQNILCKTSVLGNRQKNLYILKCTRSPSALVSSETCSVVLYSSSCCKAYLLCLSLPLRFNQKALLCSSLYYP